MLIQDVCYGTATSAWVYTSPPRDRFQSLNNTSPVFGVCHLPQLIALLHLEFVTQSELLVRHMVRARVAALAVVVDNGVMLDFLQRVFANRNYAFQRVKFLFRQFVWYQLGLRDRGATSTGGARDQEMSPSLPPGQRHKSSTSFAAVANSLRPPNRCGPQIAATIKSMRRPTPGCSQIRGTRRPWGRRILETRV